MNLFSSLLSLGTPELDRVVLLRGLLALADSAGAGDGSPVEGRSVSSLGGCVRDGAVGLADGGGIGEGGGLVVGSRLVGWDARLLDGEGQALVVWAGLDTDGLVGEGALIL